jgi:hypothetical protein
LADRELLVPEVIELEHDGIGLAAVNARVPREECEQARRSLHRERPLSSASLIDVPLFVRAVVLPFICGSTRPAEIVPLASMLSSPVELRYRLQLMAPSAPAELVGNARHEQTFAQSPDGNPA